MKKNIKEGFIILILLAVVWIPVVYNIYNYKTAFFITAGIIVSGYMGEKFLKH